MTLQSQSGIRARLLGFVASLLAVLCVAATTPVRAHDIPADVVVQLIARAAPDRVQAIVRVPLKALRDVEYPSRGPGYLDLPRAGPALDEAAQRWLAQLVEWRVAGPAARAGDAARVPGDAARVAGVSLVPDARIVALRPSLQSERPYAGWDGAYAHVTGPALDPATQVPIEQVMVDALLEWPLAAGEQPSQVHPRTERLGLRVTTALRYVQADGTVRGWELHGAPGWVALDPGAGSVFGSFVASGVSHVLGGTDHLLFVLCLALPVRRFRSLLAAVTAFTVAHSITLIGAAFGLAPDLPWFAPLVEWLIAASILWLALQNILLPADAGHRWLVAFAFGLVHGFGFSFALRDTLQFAGDHLFVALLSFNVGVELGQVAVLVAALAALLVLARTRLPERATVIVASALIAHVAWHWLEERAEPLRVLPWWPGA